MPQKKINIAELSDGQSKNNETISEKAEEIANDFAVKLLMPEEKFIQSFRKNNGILLDIAYEFGVSVQACQVRQFNLGLVTNL
jgi:Zn-dependent peptidase ImmA (M78 family)